MAAGDPKFVGIRPGLFYLQDSSGFQENDLGGWDTGTRVFLTHPKTPRAQWPKRGAADRIYPYMRVAGGIRDRLLECTMLELTVPYKGLLDQSKPHKLTPGVDTSIFTLPAAPTDTQRTRFVVPVPVPTCTREVVSFTQPTMSGVGLQVVGAPWLPAPPAWSISFLPDPDEPQTLNYRTGWHLTSRTWEELGMGTWLVSEKYTYYFSLSV